MNFNAQIEEEEEEEEEKEEEEEEEENSYKIFSYKSIFRAKSEN